MGAVTDGAAVATAGDTGYRVHSNLVRRRSARAVGVPRLGGGTMFVLTTFLLSPLLTAGVHFGVGALTAGPGLANALWQLPASVTPG